MSSTFTPTKEQVDIVGMAKTGCNLRIQAFAGASKTTTLTMVAKDLVKPSLYLAYNKAMADEAKERFPDHVEVRTTHSLAYAHIGKNYQHKLSRPKGAYKNVGGTGGEISKLFKIKDLELGEKSKLSAAAIGLAIKATVNSFEYSADRVIADKHIPFSLLSDFKKRKGFVEKTFKKDVVKYAKLLWEKRIDLQSDILCTHDTYMKLFQLSSPELSGYEVIYLDESQDSNACLLDIFENQQCQKIAVGDSFQSIYQWRGSVNAMDKLSYMEMKLTKSFRFGKEVADIATQILKDKHTGVLSNVVNGFEKVDSTAQYGVYLGDSPYTILYRSNAGLLSDAVFFIEQGKKLNIETDMTDFIKLLTSALCLFQYDLKGVKHESIIPFSSWYELKTESTGNSELSRVAKIVENGEALRYINVLEQHYNTVTPDITLTTCHRSKGREWDIVSLSDDFPSCYDKSLAWVGLDDQERNLLYVAATRAKKELYYNTTVKDMIEYTPS